MTTSTSSKSSPSNEAIKLGIDAHAKYYWVSRQVDGAIPLRSIDCQCGASLPCVDFYRQIFTPPVTLRVIPTTPCMYPVFVLQDAPRMLFRVKLNGLKLAASDYTWDGRVFWLNATLREPSNLRLTFHETNTIR